MHLWYYNMGSPHLSGGRKGDNDCPSLETQSFPFPFLISISNAQNNIKKVSTDNAFSQVHIFIWVTQWLWVSLPGPLSLVTSSFLLARPCGGEQLEEWWSSRERGRWWCVVVLRGRVVMCRQKKAGSRLIQIMRGSIDILVSWIFETS